MPNISAKEFLRNSEPPPRTSSEYIDFWLEHINRCKSGVTVGGIDISGWLYWHLNFFKITVDIEDEWGNFTPDIRNLDLRDNELLIDYAINTAYQTERNNPLMMFGTRRFAKSTVLASRIAYRSFIQQNGHSVIVGASSPDIANITKYLDEYMSVRQDCFSDLHKFGQWSKQTSSDIDIAYSKRESKMLYGEINPITEHLFSDQTDMRQKKVIFSKIAIRNLEQGQVLSKEEVLAGLTPTEVIFDEVGKYLFSKQWLALKPALSTKFGKYRTVALFVGTSGNVELARDAQRYFENPDTTGFTKIDLEEFKKYIGSGLFRFKRTSDQDTGLFVPAEMSLEGGAKIVVPLSEYVKRNYSKQELKELEGLTIEITNWDKARENVLQEINSHDKKSERDKIKMYYPFQSEDCFLSTGSNPFPIEQARKTQKALYETGMDGELIDLRQDHQTGEIIFDASRKELVEEFPYSGGGHDAPWLVFERPLANIKPNMYVAGFDGYHVETSETTDSVGSIGIFKRKIGVSGYQHQLVATLATRPNKDTVFHQQAMLGLLAYRAECLPEKDVGFYKYLQRHNMTHLLADCTNLAQGITPNTRSNVTYGLPATAENQRHIFNLLVNYCWEEIVVGHDEEGNPIMGLGVERINDPWVLEEIINFGRYKNYDRLIMFGHALAWDNELNSNNIFVDYDSSQRESEFSLDRLLSKNRARRALRPY